MNALFPIDFLSLLSTFAIKPQAINSTTISLIAYLTIRNQPQLDGRSLLVRQVERLGSRGRRWGRRGLDSPTNRQYLRYQSRVARVYHRSLCI